MNSKLGVQLNFADFVNECVLPKHYQVLRVEGKG